MAKKWVTIEAGSYAAADKTYRAGTYEVDTDDERGKALVAGAKEHNWIKVYDEEPKQELFSDSQIDYLRKMFPQFLEVTTAHQKLQAEYERLQAEKIAAAGPGANPDTMGVLTSAETRAAGRVDTGLPAAPPAAPDYEGARKTADETDTAPSVQPDWDAAKAEVQLAGATEKGGKKAETATYEAARQASGAAVADDAPAADDKADETDKKATKKDDK